MKYAFILSWLIIGRVARWVSVEYCAFSFHLFDRNVLMDKSNVLLETKSRKQIVNNLFWVPYFLLF